MSTGYRPGGPALTWAIAAMAVLGACRSDPVEPCTAEALPAIVVEIRDAQTDEPAAQGATLVVRDGSYADSVSTPAAGVLALSAALERPGSYDVVVRKPGYRDWTATDVRVRQGRCHVETVLLRARIERAP